MAKLPHPKASYGEANGNYVHGLSKTVLYFIWKTMKQRCYYEKHNRYENYGDRGIIVCDEWINDADAFISWAKNNGWKKGLQIDRRDNNGPYSPENCRFVTPLDNSNNRSMQKNNTSGFVGVTNYTRNRKKWIAYIYIKRKRKFLGHFDSPYEAALARDDFIIKHKIKRKLSFECKKGDNQT